LGKSGHQLEIQMKSLNGFLYVTLALLLTACFGSGSVMAQEPTAQAQMTINWNAPITGGPVDDYALTCTGSFPIDTITTGTSHTSAPIDVTNGQQLSGSCSLTARNAIGASPAATADYLYSVAVSVPPGPPTDFTITLDCTMVDGVVSCEQV
jgi:hypothetical protein